MPSSLSGAEHRSSDDINRRKAQASTNELEQFFMTIEKRAYQMALFAVRNHHDALDIVQESMIKLVERYFDKPAHEYKPLFYRILQNKINDWHRHQKLRNLLFFWQNQNDINDTDEQDDWLESVSAVNNQQTSPVNELQAKQLQAKFTKALNSLSKQQQQCYLLRHWEGFSVAETATIMDCSEGSIKTHYSRAAAKLHELLAESDLASEASENALNCKTQAKPIHLTQDNQKEQKQGGQYD